MPFDCSSHLRVYWADRPLAQTGARYLACLLCCLAPAYSQTASSSPQWTESVWFGGVVAVVAVLQLQRFMRTGRKLCLLYLATIGVGAWVIEASALPSDTRASDGQMTLPVAHMLFAAAVVAGAWWMANRERTQAALAAAALQGHIASQREALEKLQASHIALESKVSQRTHELHLAVQQIEMLSAQDGLTGVARRRHFDEMLRVECSRAARSRQALSVAIIAVDWFPEFNARYGHESGDACLCQLARVLETGVMRSGDLIARYSGSSFVLLAPDTDAHGILSIANYLCQEVLRLALPHHDSPYGCVSISIGVATANTHALGPDPHDPQGLLLQAQSCLASAQVQGRNQVSAF